MEYEPNYDTGFDSRRSETAYIPPELVGKENGWTRKGLVSSLKVHHRDSYLNVSKIRTLRRGGYYIDNPDSDTVTVSYKDQKGQKRVTSLPSERVTIIRRDNTAAPYALLNY